MILLYNVCVNSKVSYPKGSPSTTAVVVNLIGHFHIPLRHVLLSLLQLEGVYCYFYRGYETEQWNSVQNFQWFESRQNAKSAEFAHIML